MITIPLFWVVILDIAAWFFFHMSISLSLMKVSDKWYDQRSKGFTPWKWEKNGEIWQTVFRIRSWKKFLPDGTIIVKTAYDKTNLHEVDPVNLHKFIIETKRAELTHWALIPPAFLFFLWNPPWAGWCMILYALIANMPFIIAQRYNRPRLERLYQLMLKRKKRNKNYF